MDNAAIELYKSVTTRKNQLDMLIVLTSFKSINCSNAIYYDTDSIYLAPINERQEIREQGGKNNG